MASSTTASSEKTISVTFPEQDIALLTFDMPDKGANVLSSHVLHELSGHLDELEKRTDLVGLVFISGKPGQFIAGADLREFAESIDIGEEKTAEMCSQGQSLFRRLSTDCPFVTVAAIEGICVGGGAELAAWCDRRIMSDHKKTEFGFPEVKLGLFPGWGGTVRAPRIAGLSNAVEMITGGNSISAKEAYEMGWASDVVSSEDLLAAAINLVRVEHENGDWKKDRQLWDGPIDISEAELGFLGATASALIQQHSKGHYPAPMKALETMMGGSMVDAKSACQMEATGMANLFGSPINKSLLNIFFLTDRNKKDTGIDAAVDPASVESCGVIGAGIMGAGIAAANAKRKIIATLTDTRQEALATGVQSVLDELSYDKATKSKCVKKAIEMAPMVSGTLSAAELGSCDLVIEAVIENAEIKQQVYANLEPHMSETAILASNTSTIPISDLASKLKHPERFCGIHFFNPVRKMKLVEVIRGRQTSDQTVATAVAYSKKIGKMPIVVNDGPGFLVNRLLLPYMNEALTLIQEGASIKDVESAAKKFGMPMGPITLYDVVGLDTAVYAGKVLVESFPDRFTGSPILPSLVKAGRLGQKSGSGFFAYGGKKKKGKPDPELDRFLQPHLKSDPKKFTKQEITDRLFLPMLTEATRILEEKLVRDARDIDLGLIFGIGFPPFKGGLMFWADSLGAAKVAEMLKPYEALGKRYQPTELMSSLAASNGKYYGDGEVA